MTVEQLGKKIRIRRRLSLLTLKELGEKSGIAASSIHAWEKGTREPRFSHILKLEKIIDLGIINKEILAQIDEEQVNEQV